MNKIRLVNTSYRVGGESLYRIQEHTWFWGWSDLGHVWGKTIEDAWKTAVDSE